MESAALEEKYNKKKYEGERLIIIARRSDSIPVEELYGMVLDVKNCLNAEIKQITVSRQNLMEKFKGMISTFGYFVPGNHVIMAIKQNDIKFSKGEQNEMMMMARCFISDAKLSWRFNQELLVYIPTKIRRMHPGLSLSIEPTEEKEPKRKPRDQQSLPEDKRVRLRMENKVIVRHMIDDHLINKIASQLGDHLAIKRKIAMAAVILSSTCIVLLTSCAAMDVIKK